MNAKSIIHIRIIPINAPNQVFRVQLRQGRTVLAERNAPTRMALTQALYVLTRLPKFARCIQTGLRGRTGNESDPQSPPQKKVKPVDYRALIKAQRAQERALQMPSGFLKEKRTRE